MVGEADGCVRSAMSGVDGITPLLQPHIVQTLYIQCIPGQSQPASLDIMSDPSEKGWGN